MIKPTDTLRISEPVEQMYMDCTSQLIINLCRHFATDKDMSTARWEIKKLSELDQLTEESIEIIAANTGKSKKVIQKAITEAVGLELKDAEKTLQGAAAAGTITTATTTLQTSPMVKSVIKSLTEQAVDDSNIVNTVMLNSTRQRYLWAVQSVSSEAALIEEVQGASDIVTLEKQLAKTQKALNAATFSVASGSEARTTALRRVIGQLAAEGITGYVDRAGRQWSPEAYINMDIRTTVNNAARQAQKSRAAEYGVSTFQISSHAGARPLCAPYQGKFYSWDGSSGVVEDLYGRQYGYVGIDKTSYGEPAGIFGINCGHFPQTFVSGYNIPRYTPTEDFEENERLYKLTQQQRYYERQIRQEKTAALSYKAAGDDVGFAKAAARINSQNASYKLFCAENNLTPRLDRLQVVGYNKSVASKANAAAKVISERQDYIKTIKPTLPKSNVPLANTTLQTTVNVDIQTKGGYGLQSVAPQGAELTDVRIIAGYGTSSTFRNAKGFAETYGGEDYQWQKVGGLIETDNYVYDVHWYQQDGNAEHYEYQIKGVKEK